MAEKLEDWLNGEVKELSKLPIGELSNTFFFRDPIRPTYIDHEHFYSPVDGTILYQKIVQPHEAVIEIKGMNYTLKDVMGDEDYNKPSLVIGIFMSFYDVHINRIPYGGVLTFKNLEPIEKTKNICCVLSNKIQTEGHRLRKTFTEKYLEKYNLDLFDFISFRNSNIPNNDKFSTLKDYKYCLGFDNQDFIDDFIGTQFTDAILSFTVPIFWCGTDLSKYYPEGSFIQFNARDFNEIDRIKDIISKDDYYKRLPALKEARDMILNKYNFWPTIKKIIDTNGK